MGSILWTRPFLLPVHVHGFLIGSCTLTACKFISTWYFEITEFILFFTEDSEA